MVKLSKKETKVYEAMLKDPNRVWSASGIARLVHKGTVKDRPKYWYATTQAMMRTLSLKTKALGFLVHVNRVTKQGRGNIALYKLEEEKDTQKKLFNSSKKGV